MIWKLSFFQWTPSIELNKLKLDYHCEVSLFQWIFISRFSVAFICLSHSLLWWHLTSGYGWFESYFLQLAAIRFSINELPINFYFFLHCCAISISLFRSKLNCFSSLSSSSVFQQRREDNLQIKSSGVVTEKSSI